MRLQLQLIELSFGRFIAVRNFWKYYNKFLEIFRQKFLENSELTTLYVACKSEMFTMTIKQKYRSQLTSKLCHLVQFLKLSKYDADMLYKKSAHLTIAERCTPTNGNSDT